MSDVNVSFGYSPLSDFMSSGFTLPKAINVIPVFRIKDRENAYGILTLNKNLVVQSFGIGMSKNKTLVTYISDCLRFNSLGLISVSDEYIKENSYVAYSKSYDVYKGVNVINPNYQPIVFVEFKGDSIEQLNKLIHTFRVMFSTKLAGVITSESDVVALTYMDCTSMFYLFRFTEGKVSQENTGVVHRFSIEDDGFPALDFITETYKCDKTKGEIPFSDNVDVLANSCPEIEFYKKIDHSLGVAFVAYSIAELPFM